MAAGDSIAILGSSDCKYTKADWGIDDNLLGFIATTSVSVNNTKDLAEAKNNKGETVAVAVSNGRSEITIEGIGTPDDDTDDTGAFGLVVGALKEITEISAKIYGDNSKMVITESSVDLANEDWVKYSIKGTVYELVTEVKEAAGAE